MDGAIAQGLLAVYNCRDDRTGKHTVKLRSLGLRSDLSLLNAEVLDRGDYLLVRSPEEPNFYWGNLLVFPRPPQAGDFEQWESLFAGEFHDSPGVLHKTFAWDVSEDAADTTAFASAGYRVEHSVVLRASEVVPAKFPNGDVTIRTLLREADWAKLLELEVLSRDEGHAEADFTEFARARHRGYRKRIDAGQGHWYGAFLGDRMVASLGIFRCGSSARFQVVVTHPDFRRQGICGTLVHHAAREALVHPSTDTLLMVADTEYHAARIYESLGFAPAEHLHGLCRWPT